MSEGSQLSLGLGLGSGGRQDMLKVFLNPLKLNVNRLNPDALL